MIDTFREGWTERIKYNLTKKNEAGVVSVVVLTGLTVGLVAYDRNQEAVEFSGTAGIDDATAGTVYFDPTSTDLKAAKSPYSISWTVTDDSGKTAFFPREDDLVWTVKR